MAADPNNILIQLTEGTILEGPHWTEPVKVLTAKARGNRVEVRAVGLNTKRLWNKLLNADEFDGVIKVTRAGELAALDGDRQANRRKPCDSLPAVATEIRKTAIWTEAEGEGAGWSDTRIFAADGSAEGRVISFSTGRYRVRVGRQIGPSGRTSIL